MSTPGLAICESDGDMTVKLKNTAPVSAAGVTCVARRRLYQRQDKPRNHY